MRKIIALEHISLDGVIQAPGGPDEDTSGGFMHGGWIAGYSDKSLGMALRKQMNSQFDLLVGRTTFEIWEPYWPQHTDLWPNVNAATKYVTSKTRTCSDWQPTVFLNGNVAEKVTKIELPCHNGEALLVDELCPEPRQGPLVGRIELIHENMQDRQAQDGIAE